MSMDSFYGAPREKDQWQCPNCGATSEKGVGPIAEDGSTGTVICGACGKKFPEMVADGSKFDDADAASPRPARNPLALVVVAVVVAGMLYFGFHMARRSGPNRAPGMARAIDAPDFTLESLDGRSVRLSDLRGKAVLLNFWATWCVPCKIEMPWLVELQSEYGPQGLQIVGVAMDDSSKEDIAKFTKDMGVNYPVLLGKNAVADAYEVPAMPESFFISRDGKIVDKIIGLKGKADIADAVLKALNAQPTAPPTTAAAAQAQK